MPILDIDFAYGDDVARSLKKATRALENRIDDYNGIITRISGIGGLSDNASSANYYIRKKVDRLREEHEQLSHLRAQTDAFVSVAENADKLVASRINTESNDFYKREGIRNGILYSICSLYSKATDWLKGFAENYVSSFCDFLASTSLGQRILEFYHEHELLFRLLGELMRDTWNLFKSHLSIGLIVGEIILSHGAACQDPWFILNMIITEYEHRSAIAETFYDLLAFGDYLFFGGERSEALADSGLFGLNDFLASAAAKISVYGAALPFEIAALIAGSDSEFGRTTNQIVSLLANVFSNALQGYAGIHVSKIDLFANWLEAAEPIMGAYSIKFPSSPINGLFNAVNYGLNRIFDSVDLTLGQFNESNTGKTFYGLTDTISVLFGEGGIVDGLDHLETFSTWDSLKDYASGILERLKQSETLNSIPRLIESIKKLIGSFYLGNYFGSHGE